MKTIYFLLLSALTLSGATIDYRAPGFLLVGTNLTVVDRTPFVMDSPLTNGIEMWPVPTPSNWLTSPISAEMIAASNALYYQLYSSTNWCVHTNTRLPYVLGTSFTTNWVTRSCTRPICCEGGCTHAIGLIGSKHQVGSVYSNALLVVTYQGAQYTNVLSSTCLPDRPERDVSDLEGSGIRWP